MVDVSKEIRKYDIEEILTYLDCSMCHHLKYNLKVIPPATAFMKQKNTYFKEAIQESIAFYYRNHSEKKPLLIKQLYNKFHQSWVAKNGTEEEVSILTRKLDDAGHIQREKESKYILSGYEMLQKFFIYNNEMKQSVLAFNESYELAVGNILIEGAIPLIREVEIEGRREIHLVNFSTSKKNFKALEIKNNFSYMLHAFAFQQMLKINPDKVIVYNLHKNEETYIHYSRNDYKRLFNVLESFSQMVGKVKPFPTVNVHTYSTLYKDLCDNYNYDINPL